MLVYLQIFEKYAYNNLFNVIVIDPKQLTVFNSKVYLINTVLNGLNKWRLKFINTMDRDLNKLKVKKNHIL